MGNRKDDYQLPITNYQLPITAMNYLLHLLIYLSIYLIVSLSLNLIVGYCGLLTLAHAGYFALGSYVYALATLKLGWGFMPATILSIGIAAVLSLAVSLPAWRFRGDFFVMITLAVQVLLFGLFYNWTALTGGALGLAGIPKPKLLGIQFDSIGAMAMLSLVLAGGCTLICWLLLNSPWGRLLQAMRDDELATRALGKNTRLLKVQAFAFACSMVAIAGVIYAAYVSYIDPSAAALDRSILMLCMVIVGGVGNFWGPLVGAAVLVAIPEVLRFTFIPDAYAANIRLLLYGLLLVVMMHFRPQGLAGNYRID
ncbi:MAG TPA: branched-chain amino acid ABC transporter permease [Cyanobacteria bacterium UBA11369]|nr:branched-chain amino acid ABC transporter permease [Cyanobacteria bacterium UBA11371]HBE32911.1 branched-chain amino acid ABC transporter permease [Cyanobacteria bacterium UBA11368]HBE48772.1 branched-chain amino acid ABC transporter permease [Cyanobacteria bacterium UBA11369]